MLQILLLEEVQHVVPRHFLLSSLIATTLGEPVPAGSLRLVLLYAASLLVAVANTLHGIGVPLACRVQIPVEGLLLALPYIFPAFVVASESVLCLGVLLLCCFDKKLYCLALA